MCVCFSESHSSWDDNLKRNLTLYHGNLTWIPFHTTVFFGLTLYQAAIEKKIYMAGIPGLLWKEIQKTKNDFYIEILQQKSDEFN
jgi:hypothetical protein